ncbi:Sau3AI family type II restriction endonuclease [Paratractidigestivibacter sp.]|uniref:Sau3AI family type II restriction endonuclease n=1 Tax=Paratractidigestivibacter sp. TaxID=2847316 RepID=UPI002AC98A2E|nr:Sau3AI family type II restriction endonuclease [Paratractidigestivibacter sp.]
MGKNIDRVYDRSNKDSIIEYAQRLVGKSLREVTDAGELADPHKRRGSFGNAIEEYYFGYTPNSDSHADFSEVGLELKATPIKTVKKGKRTETAAKERLVLGMIDYMSLPAEKDFEHSHLAEKCSDMLLVTYQYEEDANPIDYVIKSVAEWGIPKEDLPQIRADWQTIYDKVCAGHAEEISGSDTMYLEACTKAANSAVRREQPFSDVPAKPRAWALKASYMTTVQRGLLKQMEALPRSEGEKNLDLLSLVRDRFSAHFGKTEQELQEEFGLSNSKHLCARITRRILGVDDNNQIAEFMKAGIVPKTIRLMRSGRPKEAVSFPYFDYFELEKTEFENSNFYGYLQQKYLFVLYREDDDGNYRLSDICFWQMPDSDLDEAKRCYDQMRRNVRDGRADLSAKSTENRCCHVRPHGRDGKDTLPQPHGAPVVKKCFWLNQSYLADEIAKAVS